MFNKILIANRGEIAVRIIRACREMGISTVAIYSEADAESLHVRLADEAICVGPAPSAQSYLNMASIISAAEVTDSEAIHPGYGFFAENDHFAEICESCDIRFIGPSAELIRMLGDKAMAKKICREHQVPVVPGFEGAVPTVEIAKEEAEKIGYPLLIKAVAGGGGKGIREVHTALSFGNAFMTTRTEAEAAFGRGDVYLEKLIQEPRHVEVQIMADSHGNVVHLGERDCTVQRRHQKLIEESPSPAVSEATRIQMGEAAVRLAKGSGYTNAGTVEFLLDKDGDFYFIEMNTRIQVEHTVTEQVTGIDLIKEQICVAAGEPLSVTQEDVQIQGHAFEVRVNAEDWENDFRPCPGPIPFCHLPGGRNTRVDSHIYSGYSIPPHYDSMIGKIITWGKDRRSARKLMERALDECVIEGVKTTIPFCRRIFNDGHFKSGQYSTHFVDEFTQS